MSCETSLTGVIAICETVLETSAPHRPSPRTAPEELSIWRDLSEDTFRIHLVDLEARTNAIPMLPTIFPPSTEYIKPSEHVLSLPDEQSIADDFAYLASGEGAQSVVAVCLEPLATGICLRIAGADVVDLTEMGQILMSSPTGIQVLLSCIIKLHRPKLLGRVRSIKWQKPKYLSRTHKKALWQDFETLLHRAQHIFPGKNNPEGLKVTSLLIELQKILKEFENVPISMDKSSLEMVVRSCYSFCRSALVIEFANRLERITKPTAQVLAAIKNLRQIEKIGAYQRIAQDMVKYIQRYPSLFVNVEFKYLQPYQAIPTTIGYEDWAKTTHIHAEIQLAVFYDLQNQAGDRIPQTIGTSKYLCYLCYLFMKYHNHWTPSSCHGRLYDQWSIPDLSEFNDATRQEYRTLLEKMDREIFELAKTIPLRPGKREAWRAEPMTSRQNLLHLPVEEPVAEETVAIR